MICNISLTNFVSSISSHIRHQMYIIHIKSSYQIPSDQGLQGHYFKLRETSRYYATFLSQISFLPLSSHNRHRMYITHIESSYQNPPDQGFCGHYFKRRELQGIMQYFLSQISFLSLQITLDIICISFISNLHIKFLQIKTSRVTTSNSENFKVL